MLCGCHARQHGRRQHGGRRLVAKHEKVERRHVADKRKQQQEKHGFDAVKVGVGARHLAQLGAAERTRLAGALELPRLPVVDEDILAAAVCIQETELGTIGEEEGFGGGSM